MYWDGLHNFVNGLNYQRSLVGQSPIQINGQLCEDCQRHNEFMASIGHLEHSDQGICSLRENVGMKTFFGTVNWNCETKCFLDMWMNCEYHRDNLLASGSEIGLALYISGNRIYATYRIK